MLIKFKLKINKQIINALTAQPPNLNPRNEFFSCRLIGFMFNKPIEISWATWRND
jgi:hypothetical protein